MVLFAKQEGWGGLTGLAPPVFTSWAQTQTRFFQLLPPLLPPHRAAKPPSRNTTSPTGSAFPENYLSFKV